MDDFREPRGLMELVMDGKTHPCNDCTPLEDQRKDPLEDPSNPKTENNGQWFYCTHVRNFFWRTPDGGRLDFIPWPTEAVLTEVGDNLLERICVAVDLYESEFRTQERRGRTLD